MAMTLGIQLYTVRQDCTKDFKGTVTALAKMGYQAVEFAGVYGNMEPRELAAFLAGLKLKTAGLHVSLPDIANPDSPAYAYAAALKAPHLTTSLAGHVAKDWKGIIPEVAKAAAVAKGKGLLFTYHNHAQEFAKVDGVYAQDMLYQQTDPKTVAFELDTFWIAKGGENPVAYIAKYAGRVPEVHLKDMDPSDQTFTEVGNGTMDLPAIFAASEKAGARWMIVEQDSGKRAMMESAEISIRNLKNRKLV
jgi:sugar phosphate isomerase/epimerase